MSAGEADLSVQITGQANNMACHSRQGTYLSPKEKLEDQNGWSDRTNLSLWAKLGDENGYQAYLEYKQKFLGRIYVSIPELDTQKGLEN